MFHGSLYDGNHEDGLRRWSWRSSLYDLRHDCGLVLHVVLPVFYDASDTLPYAIPSLERCVLMPRALWASMASQIGDADSFLASLLTSGFVYLSKFMFKAPPIQRIKVCSSKNDWVKIGTV